MKKRLFLIIPALLGMILIGCANSSNNNGETSNNGGENTDSGNNNNNGDDSGDNNGDSSSDPQTFVISFNSNGGSSIDSVTVEEGQLLTKPIDPTKDGFDFDGWYKNSGLTTLYDFSTPVYSSFILYAGWTAVVPDTWTVNFISDGVTLSTQEVLDGELLEEPEDPTKDGYVFSGWFKKGESERFDFATPITSSFDLTAKWSLQEYMVTFNLNYNDLPSVQYSTVDGLITFIPERSGYVFNGWWYCDGFVNDSPILNRSFDLNSKVTADGLELFAEWVEEKTYSNQLDAPVVTVSDSYLISWDSIEHATQYDFSITAKVNSSTETYVDTQISNTYYQFDTSFSANSYTIKVRAKGDGANYRNSSYVTKTIAYKMLTSPRNLTYNEYKYLLEWDVVPNATSYELSFKRDSQTTSTEVDTNDNFYYFNNYDAGSYSVKVTAKRDGWASSSSSTISFSKYYLKTPVGLMATFEEDNERYKISWWDNVAHADSYKIYVNGEEKETVTSRSYYIARQSDLFTAEQIEISVAAFDSNADYLISPVSEPITIEKVYKINYELDGGTNNSNNKNFYSKSDENIELYEPTRTNCFFLGWLLNDKSVSIISTNIAKDITLIATWNVRYDITYILDGGINNSLNPSYYYPSDDEIVLAEPTKTGYTFGGWFDESGNQVTSIATGTTGSLTLTARWNGGNTYSITLNPNGGEVSETLIDVQYDHVYSLPTPTRLGYTFDGWFEDSTQISNSGTWNFICNKTFVAHWTITNYSIVYELNGGTNSSYNPSSYTVEDEIIFEDAICNKDGYHFGGWYDNENQITKISKGTIGDITIEARWFGNLNNLSVTSENTSKGTVAIASGSGYSGESITVVATPIDDCIFKGWYHESTKVSDDEIYTFTMPINDFSLVAHFITKIEEETWNIAHGIAPFVDTDAMTVTYGLYPQTVVDDENLITALNALDNSAIGSNGWYLYGDEYYARLCATPYQITGMSNDRFGNGKIIKNNTDYWFKCEPITWNILSNNDGEYYLLSSVLLDARYYHYSTSSSTIDDKTVYASNYEYSSTRYWLNNTFYNSAFALNGEYIQTTIVDNGTSTTASTGNKYTCNNTSDKVFLPSYQDYINSSYGFSATGDSTDTRCCEATDWAKAKGLCYFHGSGNSYFHGYNYWTRSPYSSNYAFGVIYDGDIAASPVNDATSGVRPAITIKIS